MFQLLSSKTTLDSFYENQIEMHFIVTVNVEVSPTQPLPLSLALKFRKFGCFCSKKFHKHHFFLSNPVQCCCQDWCGRQYIETLRNFHSITEILAKLLPWKSWYSSHELQWRPDSGAQFRSCALVHYKRIVKTGFFLIGLLRQRYTFRPATSVAIVNREHHPTSLSLFLTYTQLKLVRSL